MNNNCYPIKVITHMGLRSLGYYNYYVNSAHFSMISLCCNAAIPTLHI